MIARGAVLLAGLVLGGAGGVAAQDPDPFGRRASSGGPTLDSVVVAAAAGPTWRDLLLGPWGGRAFLDVALAGRPVTAVGAWGLSAHAEGTLVADARTRSPSDGHFGGGLTVSRYLTGEGAALTLAADAYHVPGADDEASGVEVGLAARNLVWHWGLEEVDPTVSVGVYRDFGRFDAFRADVDLNLGFGIQNVAFAGFRDVAAWVAAHGAWSDYDGVDDLAWRLGLGGALDRGLWALLFGGGVQDPLDAALRGWGELGIRIWPAGRGL